MGPLPRLRLHALSPLFGACLSLLSVFRLHGMFAHLREPLAAVSPRFAVLGLPSPAPQRRRRRSTALRAELFLALGSALRACCALATSELTGLVFVGVCVFDASRDQAPRRVAAACRFLPRRGCRPPALASAVLSALYQRYVVGSGVPSKCPAVSAGASPWGLASSRRRSAPA